MSPEPPLPRRILLFDIDGTLLISSGAGRSALNHVFRQCFGLPADARPTAGIDFAGASDLRVVREVYREHGRACGRAEQERFVALFAAALQTTLASREGRPLPGVVPLLDRLRAEPVLLALGTGNFRRTAFVKLAHFGLDGYFDSGPRGGAFGDDGATRPEFLAAGLERVRPRAAPDAEVVVIGDTPLDVQGGRSIGARVVAVATGFSPRDALAAAAPDVLLDDLGDLDAALQAILG